MGQQPKLNWFLTFDSRRYAQQTNWGIEARGLTGQLKLSWYIDIAERLGCQRSVMMELSPCRIAILNKTWERKHPHGPDMACRWYSEISPHINFLMAIPVDLFMAVVRISHYV